MRQDPDDILGFVPEGAGEFDPPPALVKKDKVSKHEASVDTMRDPAKLVDWMEATMRLPMEAVDEVIVEQSYPAAVWIFRQAAMSGDLNATKSMEAWLEWAKPILNKPKSVRAVKPSKGSVAFLPRVPKVTKEED